MWKTDLGRTALYIYGIKCSADGEGNFGNVLIAKKINSNDLKHNISHTHVSKQLCKYGLQTCNLISGYSSLPMHDTCTLILASQDSKYFLQVSGEILSSFMADLRQGPSLGISCNHLHKHFFNLNKVSTRSCIKIEWVTNHRLV